MAAMVEVEEEAELEVFEAVAEGEEGAEEEDRHRRHLYLQ